MPAERHVEIQAAFQRHTDNAVSKTVDLPEEADVEGVKEVFLLARDHDVKGVTVFRSGARPEQVLGECASECDYVAPREERSGGGE